MLVRAGAGMAVLFLSLVVASISKAEQPSARDAGIACAEVSGTFDVASVENERSGCCSWHNGVCGCAGTRARCCDGSLSPSCGCRADTPPYDPIGTLPDPQ
jgi:hypothetical protein